MVRTCVHRSVSRVVLVLLWVGVGALGVVTVFPHLRKRLRSPLVQVQNVRLNTALHFAYEKNNRDAVEFLLSHGGDASESKRNSLGYLPRHVPIAHPVKQYIQKELSQKNLPAAAVGPRAVVALPSRT